MKLEKHKVAIILFFNDLGEILMQEKPAEKIGNQYRFFGGHMEKGETPEQTIIREVKEELNFDLKNFKFFKFYHHIDKKYLREMEKSVFISNIPEKFIVSEGNAFFTTFKKSKSQDFSEHDKMIIKEIQEYLK